MSDAFRTLAPRYMARLMADFGLDAEGAAAVMGNAGHESGGFKFMQELKPTSGRGGLGIFQWTGPRRVQYEAWLKRKGAKPGDFEADYAFLWRELTSTEKRAIPAVKAAKGLQAKVIAFENAFERSGVKAYDSRVKWAQIALEAWKANPLPITPPTRIEVPTVPIVNPEPKRALSSVTILGGLLAIILPIASKALPALGLLDPNATAEAILQLGGAFGGAMAIWGRLNATQPISGTAVARASDAANVASEPVYMPEPIATPAVETHLADQPLNKLASEMPAVIGQAMELIQAMSPLLTALSGGQTHTKPPA